MAEQTVKRKTLTPHELSVLSSQLSMLVKSGSSPYEAVSILMEDTKDPSGKQILQSMVAELEKGEKLHDAMKASGVFPDYVEHMVTIGEEAGELDTVLDALRLFYEREDGLRDTIRSALRYPLIMIATMFVVILVLITQVLPIFAEVFAQLGTGMNAFSESLLTLGVRMNRYSLAIMIVLAALVLLAVYLFHSANGKKLLRRIAGVFPAGRRLSEEIAAGRFASGMALTMSSGMDTYQSLAMVKTIVENDTVEQKIAQCAEQIEGTGCSFPEAIEQVALFTPLYTRMVKTGFKSGSLDQTMRQIADHYEKATDHKIDMLISVVEPTLIILLSVIVGLILLSVIMPLMGIMGTIG